MFSCLLPLAGIVPSFMPTQLLEIQQARTRHRRFHTGTCPRSGCNTVPGRLLRTEARLVSREQSVVGYEPGSLLMPIAALVLGIIGTVSSLIPGLFVIGLPLSLVALVLGVLGRKDAVANNRPTSTATAGLVLGCVGTAVGLSMFVLCGSL